MKEYKVNDEFNVHGHGKVYTFSDEINLDYKSLIEEGIILDGEVLEGGTFTIEPFSLGMVPTNTRTYGVLKDKDRV